MVVLSRVGAMPKGVPTRIAELSPKAQTWYEALEDKSGTVAGLIELAAADDWLSLRIVAALERMEPPDRGKAGRKVKVSDDRLRELVAKGLSPMAIGLEVGLGQAQTVRRLKKLKIES
jgi:hypothetical protein